VTLTYLFRAERTPVLWKSHFSCKFVVLKESVCDIKIASIDSYGEVGMAALPPPTWTFPYSYLGGWKHKQIVNNIIPFFEYDWRQCYLSGNWSLFVLMWQRSYHCDIAAPPVTQSHRNLRQCVCQFACALQCEQDALSPNRYRRTAFVLGSFGKRSGQMVISRWFWISSN